MKYMFVLENLTDQCGANVNIGIKLAMELQAKGNTVFALSRFDNFKPLSKALVKNFDKVYSFYSNQSGSLNEFTNGKWKCMGKFRKVISLFRHPHYLFYMIDAKYFEFTYTERVYKKEIENVCKNLNVDVIVGISAPYYIAKAISKANITSKKCIIQLDPFTYNYTLVKKLIFRRKRIETRVINKLDKVFAVSFVYDELINKNITTELAKVKYIELPGIESKITLDNSYYSFDNTHKTIHLLFAGQFYKDIRNPRYLLQLIQYMPKNCVLHIVGSGCEEMVNEYKAKVGDRLIIHGRMSKEDCNKLVKKADVLVNLNNTVNNQMPSKILEYICTKKIILNVCKHENCLSLALLNKYPKCVNVYETKQLTTEYIAYVMSEIQNKLEVRIESKELLKIFHNYTFEHIADVIEKVIVES